MAEWWEQGEIVQPAQTENWWDSGEVVEEKPKKKKLAPPKQVVNPPAPPGFLERATMPFIQGLQQSGQGVVQAGLQAGEFLGAGDVMQGLGMPSAEDYTQQAMQQQQAYQERYQPNLGANIATMAGEAAGYAPLGGVGIAKNALFGAIPAAGQFVRPGESRALNTALGGALGAALPAVAEVPSKITSLARTKPGMDDVIETGRQWDVPVYGADIAAAPQTQRAGVRAEGLSTKMGEARETQARKALEAAKRLKGTYDIEDDIGDTIVGSMNQQFKKLKAVDNRNYKALSEATGYTPVPMGRTSMVAKRILAEEMKKPERFRNQDAIALVEKYTDPEGADFMTLNAIRSDIGDDVAKMTQAGDRKGARHLRAIRKAISNDMESYANKQGAGELWEQAKKFHQENIAPYNKADIRRTMNEVDTDEVYARFVKASKEGKPRRLYNALDDKGKAAVKAGIINEAFEKAYDESRDFLSPAKFASALDKKEKSVKIFFPQADVQELSGFKNLMRTVERAGQYQANPPTGQRTTETLMQGFISGAGALGYASTGDPVTSLATSGAVFGLMKAPVMAARGLLGTEGGRDFLRRLAKMNPKTKATQEYISRYLPQLIGTQVDGVLVNGEPPQ